MEFKTYNIVNVLYIWGYTFQVFLLNWKLKLMITLNNYYSNQLLNRLLGCLSFLFFFYEVEMNISSFHEALHNIIPLEYSECKHR